MPYRLDMQRFTTRIEHHVFLSFLNELNFEESFNAVALEKRHSVKRCALEKRDSMKRCALEKRDSMKRCALKRCNLGNEPCKSVP